MNSTVNIEEEMRQCQSRLRNAAARVGNLRKIVWNPIKVASSATALTAVSGWAAINFIWWANVAIPDKNLSYESIASAIFVVGAIGGITAISWSEVLSNGARHERFLLRREKCKLAEAKKKAKENGIDIRKALMRL